MHASFTAITSILLLQLQQQLAEIAGRAEKGEFFYTRFFAIGVFRLLELTDTRDPKALEGLVKVCHCICC
jgi:hypothetical protein